MRRLGFAMICLCACAATACAQEEPAPAGPGEPVAPAPAMAPKEAGVIASYGIGMNAGRSMKDQGVDIDLETFIQGIRDGLSAAKPKYSEQQIRAALTVFQGEIRAKQEKRQQAAGGKNKSEGQAFLAANKAKEGVKTLPSGLQYQVVRPGSGASPKATDTVKVHYEGTLLDGTVFDSSIKRKEPAVFPVRGVIPGWTEALQLMKVGEKWKLFIPSELAYGARGAGRAIGPHSVLVFDVELLGIEAPAAKDAQPQESRGQE
jgi:FKBP-type peptidyl-prolyl cis-trans isomerase FklB